MSAEARVPHTKLLWVLVAFVVLLGLWFLFRPERLVINQAVDEPFPGLVVPPAFHTGHRDRG